MSASAVARRTLPPLRSLRRCSLIGGAAPPRRSFYSDGGAADWPVRRRQSRGSELTGRGGAPRRNLCSAGERHDPPEPPLYPGHIRTDCLQRALLAVGSAVVGLADPTRADMVAVNGEVTGGFALERLHSLMRSDGEGRGVLRSRPRLTTAGGLRMDALAALPPASIGRVYADFAARHEFARDGRAEVRFVDDEELAYVMQRYREIHDVVHAVLAQPPTLVGEVLVKWVEALQTGLPMCVGGALLGPLRFTAPRQTARYRRLLPWAVDVGKDAKLFVNVHFEERWEQDIHDFRREMNIAWPPPT